MFFQFKIHFFDIFFFAFREELTKIANLCKKYNVLCVSDEVYEWMIYDGNEHIRICKFISSILH